MSTLTDIRPDIRRFLPKTGQPYVMALLDQNHLPQITGLFNALSTRERSELSHKKRSDFERHFAAGHLMVGAVGESGLMAQSLLVLPTPAYPETGIYGMPFSAPPQEIAVVSNMMVRPDCRGNALQGELISACMSLAVDRGRTHMISDVYTDNQASWKTFLKKGFSIHSMDANPAISSRAVYFLHARVPLPADGGLRRAFNSVSVPIPDLESQRELLAKGYRGIGYDSGRGLLSFGKAP